MASSSTHSSLRTTFQALELNTKVSEGSERLVEMMGGMVSRVSQCVGRSSVFETTTPLWQDFPEPTRRAPCAGCVASESAKHRIQAHHLPGFPRGDDESQHFFLLTRNRCCNACDICCAHMDRHESWRRGTVGVSGSNQLMLQWVGCETLTCATRGSNGRRWSLKVRAHRSRSQASLRSRMGARPRNHRVDTTAANSDHGTILLSESVRHRCPRNRTAMFPEEDGPIEVASTQRNAQCQPDSGHPGQPRLEGGACQACDP